MSMLAYSIFSTFNDMVDKPTIVIGNAGKNVDLQPDRPLNNSYWFCILDAKNPTTKVKEFVVPGASNSTVPTGLDDYMKDPKYIITLVTQNLTIINVPQGDLYGYLVNHGAGSQLQWLEQLNTVSSCGMYKSVSYVLTTQGGASFGYEKSSDTERVRYLMSLKQNGSAYIPCDAYSFPI